MYTSETTNLKFFEKKFFNFSIEQQKDTEFPQAIDPTNEIKTQKRCLKKTQHNMIYMIFL